MSSYSLFRYPGGKSKLLKKIFPLIESRIKDSNIYIDPFFGGGSSSLYVLETYTHIDKFIFSDLDLDLVNLWNTVIKSPHDLIKLINNYQPTVESFYEFKKDLEVSKDQDPIISGFKKLVIHQLSYSGLGCKAGGPIGGINQTSTYKVDCRWSPKLLEKKIIKFNKLFLQRNVREIYNLDFKDCINNYNFPQGFTYLDPPYYIKGNELYLNGFSDKDHLDLQEVLTNFIGQWALSYDKVMYIENLYSHLATIHPLNVNYSITTSREKEEILIIKK